MKACFVTVLLLYCGGKIFSQGVPISPHIMGQNYWYSKWTDPKNSQISIYGDYFAYGSQGTSTIWPLVREAKPQLCRIGGKDFNIGGEKPQSSQEVYYVSIVDDIRKNGCEPVLTLPFLLAVKNPNTAEPNYSLTGQYADAVAASISTLQAILHLVNTVHKRNVRYVILGNEPDLDYKWSTESPFNLTAAQIASNIAGYIKPMADAVRAMENEMGISMHIIGPEYSHCLPDVYDKLFTPTITATYIGGLNPTTQKPYLNSASVHLYGPDFNDAATSHSTSYTPSISAWTPSVTFCNIERYSKEWYEQPWQARRYRGALHYMRQKVNQCSLNRGAQHPFGWMVTEMNSGHKNTAATSTSAATDAVGVDAVSMQGAQNLARMYALALEYGASSVMLWSVREGHPSFPHQDRGFLTYDQGDKRPSWFHYKMLADHFKGTYYRDEELAAHTISPSTVSIAGFDLAPNSTTAQVRGPEWLHFKANDATYTVNFESNLQSLLETKAFAAAGANISIMVLNQSTNSQSVAIRFSSGTFTSSSATKKFRFSISSVTSTNTEICFNQASGSLAAVQASSTEVFIFDCQGTFLQRHVFSLNDHAQQYNKTFSVTTYSTPSTFTAQIASSSTNNCLGVDNNTMTATPGYSNYAWKKLPNSGFVYTGSINQRSPFNSGLYQVMASSGCGTVATTAVVHQNSPLVDGGSDLNTCVASSHTLGNSTLPLSASSYTWLGLTTSLLTGKTISVNSSTLSSRTVTMTVTEGGCTYADLINIAAPSNTNIVMVKDDPLDFGIVPNNTSSPFDSPDIWVTNGCSSSVSGGYINLVANSSVCINVRVRNLSCSAVNNVTVSLFHATGNPSNNWPSRWTPTYSCSNVIPSGWNCLPWSGVCGDKIGTNSTVSVPAFTAGGSTVVQFPWLVPPLPVCGGKKGFAVPQAWALTATISAPGDPIQALATNVTANTTTNNNVALRQVGVISSSVDSQGNPFGIIIRNDDNEGGIRFDYLAGEDHNEETVLSYGNVYVYFTDELLQKWIDGAEQGDGIVMLTDTSVQVLTANAYMDNMNMMPGEVQTLGVAVEPTVPVDLSGGQYFDFDVLQRPTGDPATLTGGFRFKIEKEGWACESCESSGSRVMATSLTGSVENDTIDVQGDLNVGDNETLEINRCVLKFEEGRRLKLEPGGQLVLKNSKLVAACPGKQWIGIEVSGDERSVNNFTLEGCYIRDALQPLVLDSTQGASVIRNAFVGKGIEYGSAITMRNSTGFDVTENSIARFSAGIDVAHTYSSGTLSHIDKNSIQLVHYGIASFTDDHSNTTFNCNILKYDQVGIAADSSVFMNFGDSTLGAGNKFKCFGACSGQHGIRLQACNNPLYYHHPGDPDTASISLNKAQSAMARNCKRFDNQQSGNRVATLANYNKSRYLRVVPNPSNSVFTIHLEGDGGIRSVTIYDLTGKIVENVDLLKEQTELKVDLSERTKGMYIAAINLNTGETIFTKLLWDAQ
jgi:hypothetical protein